MFPVFALSRIECVRAMGFPPVKLAFGGVWLIIGLHMATLMR